MTQLCATDTLPKKEKVGEEEPCFPAPVAGKRRKKPESRARGDGGGKVAELERTRPENRQASRRARTLSAHSSARWTTSRSPARTERAR